MKNNYKPLGYIILKPILSPIYKFYYNPKIIGKENIPNAGSILIVGNHKHIMDQCSIIVSTKRIIHYLAKSEYFNGKMAWFFRATGCIPVDRESHDGKAKSAAIQLLKNNQAIGLFPEGTRIKTKERLMLDFKFGTVSMAQKTGAKIIPYAITGDYKFRSKNLMIRIGKPYTINPNKSLEDANRELYNKIEELLLENLKETNRTITEEMNSHMEQK